MHLQNRTKPKRNNNPANWKSSIPPKSANSSKSNKTLSSDHTHQANSSKSRLNRFIKSPYQVNNVWTLRTIKHNSQKTSTQSHSKSTCQHISRNTLTFYSLINISKKGSFLMLIKSTSFIVSNQLQVRLCKIQIRKMMINL